jgi:hypothetical protein
LRRGCNQGPGLARVALEKTFSFQRGDVLHNRSLTREPEVFLDFARCSGSNPLVRCSA